MYYFFKFLLRKNKKEAQREKLEVNTIHITKSLYQKSSNELSLLVQDTILTLKLGPRVVISKKNESLRKKPICLEHHFCLFYPWFYYTQYRFIRIISTSKALCTGFLNFPENPPQISPSLFLKIAQISYRPFLLNQY